MILYTIIMLLLASLNLPAMIGKSKHNWMNFISFGFVIGMLTARLLSELL